MFYGESSHSLDSKHRVFVPKRFQAELRQDAEGHQIVILTRGFERCIFLFSESGFERVLGRLLTQAFGGEKLRRMQRLFFANTHRCQIDASGRLLIPEPIRVLAGLEREVVMVGVADRAEIWSKADWETFHREHDDDYDDLDVVLIGDGAPEPPGGD